MPIRSSNFLYLEKSQHKVCSVLLLGKRSGHVHTHTVRQCLGLGHWFRQLLHYIYHDYFRMHSYYLLKKVPVTESLGNSSWKDSKRYCYHKSDSYVRYHCP